METPQLHHPITSRQAARARPTEQKTRQATARRSWSQQRPHVTVTSSLRLSDSPPSGKLLIPLQRRDVRVVEGARLESVCRGNSTVGSNPTLSAILRQTLASLTAPDGKPPPNARFAPPPRTALRWTGRGSGWQATAKRRPRRASHAKDVSVASERSERVAEEDKHGLLALNLLEGRRGRFVPWVQLECGLVLGCRGLLVPHLFLDHA
jgi:hypothetical protein